MIILKILKMFKIKVKTIFWRYTKLIPMCHLQYKSRKGYGVTRHSPNPSLIVATPQSESVSHSSSQNVSPLSSHCSFSFIRYSGNADNV